MAESPSSTATARLVVDLDTGIVVSSDVLGAVLPISLGGWPGSVHWPVWSNDDQRCALAPEGFERAPGDWGQMTKRGTDALQVEVVRLGFSIVVDSSLVAIPVEEIAHGYAKGFEPLNEAVKTWIEKFCELGPIVVHQPLDPMDPSPLDVNRRSAHPMSWLELGGETSWIDTSGSMVVYLIGDLPWSGRVADREAIERMTSLASAAGPVPTSVALLSAARVAAHRGQLRLALIELGTCLEAVLFARLGLPWQAKRTLGPLTQDALKAGIPLPTDIQTAFVDPRNEAVHRGVDPDEATLKAAFALVDPLVATDYPAYSATPGAEVAHRPQRMDIVLVKPPVRDGTA